MRRFLYLLHDLFVLCLIRLFQCLLFFLPEGAKEIVGLYIGRACFLLLKERRSVALRNVGRVFKALKEGERRDLVRRCFERMGVNFVELLCLPFVKDLKERFSVHGLTHIREALEERKNIILLAFHFSNWELMGLLSKILGTKIGAVARPLKGHWLLNRSVNRLRSSLGLHVIPHKGSLKEITRCMAEGIPIAILADQREKRSKAVFVDFFGEKVPTTKTIAILSLRKDCVVIPVYLEREGFMRYRFIVSKPLPIEREGSRERLIATNTRQANAFLEDLILKHPEEWFWVHRRWARRH